MAIVLIIIETVFTYHVKLFILSANKGKPIYTTYIGDIYYSLNFVIK